ncbi:unannotated protein [freshwater metagenome]|uniref:Unannotated protein n=1 Tax=freshwater metagenome TaxID=449393 RepID=A0A6J6YVL4_9ZZZZ
MHTATLDVPVAEQAHHLVCLQGAGDRCSGRRADRYNGHAEVRAELAEPLKKFLVLQLLDNNGKSLALQREPTTSPLPSTEVGQREDHPLAAFKTFHDVLVANHGEPALDGPIRQVR